MSNFHLVKPYVKHPNKEVGGHHSFIITVGAHVMK